MILGFNLKMNPATENDYKGLVAIHKNLWLKHDFTAIDRAILFSPTLYLAKGLKEIKRSSRLFIGAQDAFYEDSGAFTGQVSLLMMRNLGIRFVIVGHSECRRYNLEDFDKVKLKLKRALELDFEVFYCFGEKMIEEEYNRVIGEEFTHTIVGLADIIKKSKGKLYFVYEPWWAIGSKNNASPEYITQVVNFIKTELKAKYNISNPACFYGGSVNSGNIIDLAKIKLDGALIGSASLDKKELQKIYKCLLNA